MVTLFKLTLWKKFTRYPKALVYVRGEWVTKNKQNQKQTKKPKAIIQVKNTYTHTHMYTRTKDIKRITIKL